MHLKVKTPNYNPLHACYIVRLWPVEVRGRIDHSDIVLHHYFAGYLSCMSFGQKRKTPFITNICCDTAIQLLNQTAPGLTNDVSFDEMITFKVFLVMVKISLISRALSLVWIVSLDNRWRFNNNEPHSMRLFQSANPWMYICRFQCLRQNMSL